MQAVSQIIEKTHEFSKPLCMAFIDYEKAFNSVEISVVMQAIRRQGVDEIYVRILQDIYQNGTATIKMHRESEKSPLRKE